MSIQPLPSEVIAQIKSSIAITNLNFVISELIKNSLDAGATRVEITVDHCKGGCIVEDDGCGILPSEFREGGGLGKLHHSSKLNAVRESHGRRGIFLASLSAMSVLTLTSRHVSHRSHNMITMHRSQIVSRQTPAPPQQYLNHFIHGTRVTVRDLFGNMPVRVKQRALQAEKQRSSNKEWEELKRCIVALLLAWPGNVNLTLKDGDSDQKLILRPTAKFSPSSIDGDIQIPWVCSVLSQAKFIPADEINSWVSVGASTSRFRISGTISLSPNATKYAQFISFGIQPLNHDEGRTILQDEINRLFSNSAFGNDEDIEQLTDAERARHAKDLRFKGDGYTTKELKGVKKGVDRWPMFYINIQQLEEERSFSGLNLDDALNNKGGDLEKMVDLLQAMVFEFLEKNHFRPRAGRGQRTKKNSVKAAEKQMRALGEPNQWHDSSFIGKKILKPSRSKSAFDQFGANVKLPSFRTSVSRPGSPFETWSRGKSSLPALSKLAAINGLEIPRPSTAPPNTGSQSIAKNVPSRHSPTASTPKTFDISRRPFEDVPVLTRRTGVEPTSTELSETIGHASAADDSELMTWTNPVTKVVSLVNKRTGLTIPANKSISSTAPALSLASRIKLDPNCPTTEPTPWIRDLLQTWDNPVFAPSEPQIPQVLFEGSDAAPQDLLHGRHHHCSQAEIDNAFKDTSAGLNGRISKSSLRKAEIISQVDKKFILVKMSTSEDGQDSQTLVLIDQHAADERIRIESLMEELCGPPRVDLAPSESSVLTASLDRPLNFDISLRDTQLLLEHRVHFLDWGIIYRIPQYDLAIRIDLKGRPVRRLTVTSLPPGILERCKLDPGLLIDLIRTEVYKFNDNPIQGHVPARGTFWLQRIHSCPQGLIDMLNSRACRSAIMFNDELTMAQCEILVRRLSRCIFPFQCAHGRPSMVPLVGVERLSGMGALLPGEDGGNVGREMRLWKQRMGRS